MKKYPLLFTLLLPLILSGCEVNNPQTAYKNVKSQFPNSTIVSLNDSKYTFIVATTNNQIFEVKCFHLDDDNISDIELLHSPNFTE